MLNNGRPSQINVWVQLAQWNFDKIHVELIGRQTQITCPKDVNADQFVRVLIKDDAYRDEIQHLGVAKIRIYTRLYNDHHGHVALNELEPFAKIEGYGTDGRFPLLIVIPQKPTFSYEQALQIQQPLRMEFPVVQQNPPLTAEQMAERKKYLARVRQQRCRQRKKVFLS